VLPDGSGASMVRDIAPVSVEGRPPSAAASARPSAPVTGASRRPHCEQ